jgi:hypothetical protein
MKIARPLSAFAAFGLVAAPVSANAAPNHITRSSANVEGGSELRAAHVLLIAAVIAAILAVVLGGKSKNNPVSS